MKIKVSEGTDIKGSIASFVEGMGYQIAEFLEVLTEEDKPLPAEELQELCKDIKININSDIAISTSKYSKNKIGFLGKEK